MACYDHDDVCEECGGSEDNIEGCLACCRDCGFPCSFDKDAEAFHDEWDEDDEACDCCEDGDVGYCDCSCCEDEE